MSAVAGEGVSIAAGARLVPREASLATLADVGKPRRNGADAAQVLALFAVDPLGLGGIVLRGGAGPARDRWLRDLAALLPAGTPFRRVPLHIPDERLLGGLDLAASLRSGRLIAQRGVLADAHEGIVVLAMAERIEASTAARLAAVIDVREVVLQREGLSLRHPAHLGIVALDESIEDDEGLATGLQDRLALCLSLEGLREGDGFIALDMDRQRIVQARVALPAVRASDEILSALCAAAHALGIASVRAPLLALRAACAAAAIAGRDEVSAQDAACAARLVFSHRATQLPAPAEDRAGDEPADEPVDQSAEPAETLPPPSAANETAIDPPAPEADTDADAQGEPPLTPQAMDDLLLAAAQAAIPLHLLAMLQAGVHRRSKARTTGRSGMLRKTKLRGRPAGVQQGEPSAGARLNLIETLRAAAPWQRLRRAQDMSLATDPARPPSRPLSPARILIRREDFRITRFKQRSATVTVFVVDASGSTALNRLAEAKGAVELLLADCYVRRDRVALIGFRGQRAELLLPPTRSLVRAKRSLAGLPGGGGTPLARAIEMAVNLADSLSRRGESPTAVFLTDGRANIALDGAPGRAKATDDALAAARRWRDSGHAALLLDSAPQPQPPARQLADTMGATYLPLPYAAATDLSRVVRAATAAPVRRD